jgi:hypothetical protein
MQRACIVLLAGMEPVQEPATVVTIKRTGSTLIVSAPYIPDFPEAARRLGGRWQEASKTWAFDARDEATVRTVVWAHYGTTGDDAPGFVTVRCEVGPDFSGLRQVYGYGRELCWRPARDASVKLGEGVRILEGAFPSSGGSRNSPSLGHGGVVVLAVRDVPRAFAERMAAAYTEASREGLERDIAHLEQQLGDVEKVWAGDQLAQRRESERGVLEKRIARRRARLAGPGDAILAEERAAPAVDREALRAERARLLARVEALDQLLASSPAEA